MAYSFVNVDDINDYFLMDTLEAIDAPSLQIQGTSEPIIVASEVTELERALLAAEDVPMEERLLRSIADLRLSVRALGRVKRLKVTTVGELCSKSAKDLMGPNFGAVSLQEVRDKLRARGLFLCGDPLI